MPEPHIAQAERQNEGNESKKEQSLMGSRFVVLEQVVDTYRFLLGRRAQVENASRVRRSWRWGWCGRWRRHRRRHNGPLSSGLSRSRPRGHWFLYDFLGQIPFRLKFSAAHPAESMNTGILRPAISATHSLVSPPNLVSPPITIPPRSQSGQWFDESLRTKVRLRVVPLLIELRRACVHPRPNLLLDELLCYHAPHVSHAIQERDSRRILAPVPPSKKDQNHPPLRRHAFDSAEAAPG